MNFVGVDVGGTKVSAARLEDGVLGEPHVVATDTSTPEALVDELVGAVEQVRDDETAAAGFGVPSAVEWETGRARASVNVPLHDIPLRQVLGERLGIPVYVDNDANVAALCEAHDGTRIVVQHLVMFTVGTGVGGGLVLSGRPYRGATGAAPEIGHILIGLDLADGAPAPQPRFPQPGSLEWLAAGTALDRLARAAAEADPDSSLGRLAAEHGHVSGRDAVDLALAGDEQGAQMLRILGERLGIGIASAINTFDPEVVAIGGGVSRAGDLLLAPARETARGYLLPGAGERCEIRLAQYGVSAGVRGAALLALEEFTADREARAEL
jgi:glucokinase